MSEKTPEPNTTGSGILGAAGVIAAATLISRILGLVREQIFAMFFGAGNMMDAFNLAFRVPNLLRNLFAEGAMSAALVPSFAQAKQRKGVRASWRLAGLVFRVLGLGVGGLAVLGWIFAPEIVSLYGSAFKAVPGKFELAMRMTRILMPFFPLVALAAAFMAVLNACGVFFVPALAPALFNLVSIVVGVALLKAIQKGTFGPTFLPIEGMAFGVLAGALVQAFCQLPFLYRAGYHWPRSRPGDLRWNRDPELRQMVGLMVPGTLGLGATQIAMFFNTVAATALGPGAVSYLSYAFRLMQFPIGIFGASLAQATLPVLARQWAERDVRAIESTLSLGLKRVFAVNLPASVGLAFLGYPIVELIFQYGRFYPEDTRSTAWALAMYATGLTAYSTVKLLVPACYALGCARVAVIASVASLGVTLGLNVATAHVWGFGGLALGTSLGAFVNAGILLVALRGRLSEVGGTWDFAPLIRVFFKNLGVALLMGVICFWTHKGLTRLVPDWEWVGLMGRSGWVIARLAKVGIVVAEGLGVIYFVRHWTGAWEFDEAVDLFTKKIKNMLSRSKT